MRAKTVGEAIDAGVTIGDLEFDMAKGYLRVEPLGEEQAEAAE
jgi:hypothetical protein